MSFGYCALLKQRGVRPSAHKRDALARSFAGQLIDQQKVAADVTFAVIGPVAF